MNKKAFTLMELLGALIIIGILTVLAFTVVNNSLNNSKQKLYDTQIESIIDAAKLWEVDNIQELMNLNVGETKVLLLDDLQREQYIDTNLNNPLTDELISPTTEITITKQQNHYTYEVKVK